MMQLPSGKLRVVPLGGLGEIGLNCLVLEWNGYAIAIDCGVMFPEPQMLGIDLVIPDLGYLEQFGERFLGFVLTHGHEDHQGALPFALRTFSVPVYATPMAHGLVTERLKEHGISAQFHVFRAGDRWELGPFALEAIHVTHSLVDTVALAIRTPLGVVIHSGDFKIDHTPVDGPPADLHRLAQYGREGVLLLLSDSTNAERPGYTPSERSLRAPLAEIFRQTKGAVFFSTFASHIHRLKQAIELSLAYDRRIAVVGRSLLTSIKIATQLGYLEYPPSLFVDAGNLSREGGQRLTILTTGSQGEAMSALIRIAEGGHHQVTMGPGDTVVLSSRVIPGNEKQISNLINHALRRGAEVFHSQNMPVHVSGHASQEELKLILRLCQPKFFVPIHGELRHLIAHRKLAWEVGVPPENTFLLENGKVLEIDATGAREVDPVKAGRVFVDGKGVGEAMDVVLRDRRHLSSDGLVLAVLALDQQTGSVVAGPDLISRGFLPESGEEIFMEEARQLLLDSLAELPPESRSDAQEVKEQVRRVLRRYFSRVLDRRPVIVPFVLEM
ncbi:MAG: ribonuclease J [Candidatus Binatia bacterium]|nr:MAG: ribonuclease J [Candidatus Binatia bacterium]